MWQTSATPAWVSNVCVALSQVRHEHNEEKSIHPSHDLKALQYMAGSHGVNERYKPISGIVSQSLTAHRAHKNATDTRHPLWAYLDIAMK